MVKEKEFKIVLKDYIQTYNKVRLDQNQIAKIINLIKGSASDEAFITASQMNDFYCSLPLEFDWINVNIFEKQIAGNQEKMSIQSTQIGQKVEEDLQKKLEQVKKKENKEEKKLSKNPNFLKIFIESADYKAQKKQRMPINFRSFFLNPTDGEINAFGGDEKKPIQLKSNLDEKGEGPLTLSFGGETIMMHCALIIDETVIRLEGKTKEGPEKLRIYFELDYWFGYYEEEDVLKNMNVFLKIVGNDVVGISTDDKGVACWQGTLEKKELRIKKKYIDKHEVSYEGFLKGAAGSSEIKGNWSYQDTDGIFYLSQQLFLESDEDDEFDLDAWDESSESNEQGVERNLEESVREIEGREAFATCHQGHPLQWTKIHLQGLYSCDNCNRCIDLSTSRWHCKNCDFDICGICKKAPLDEIEEEEPFVSCNRGHPLNWTENSGYREGIYQCDNCMENKMLSMGRWHCSKCKYDICGKCRKLPFENAQTCGENHILNWSVSQGNYPIPLYECNICSRSGKSTLKGRWHCSECCFDLCPKCRPKEDSNY